MARARGEGSNGARESEGASWSRGYVILGFRVSTTSVGTRGKGIEGNVILDFRVPTTTVAQQARE